MTFKFKLNNEVYESVLQCISKCTGSRCTW